MYLANCDKQAHPSPAQNVAQEYALRLTFKPDRTTYVCPPCYVKLDGHKIGEYESHPGSISTSLGVKRDGVQTVTLESIDIGKDEWISLLEVGRRNVKKENGMIGLCMWKPEFDART